MKKTILALCLSLLTTAYILRVYHVNKTAVVPTIIKYTIGMEVAIEEDFFDTVAENMNGYTVTILDSSLLTMDEFMKKYGSIEDDNYEMSDYMVVVQAEFRNRSNSFGESAGINLSQYILQENSFITYMDREAYKYINKFDSLAFSLNLDTKRVFILPFEVDKETAQLMKRNNPELVISLFPNKKVIEMSLS